MGKRTIFADAICLKRIMLSLIMSCFGLTLFAQTGPRLLDIPAKQTPAPGQSLYVFFVSMRADRSVVLSIDDIQIGHFFNGDTAEIAVANGKHIVRAYQKKWDAKFNIWQDDGDDRLTDTLNGIRFPVEVNHGPKLKDRKSSKLVYGNNSPAQTNSRSVISQQGLEGAVARASVVFIGELPKNSTLAVISISSAHSELATFAIDELEYQLVTSKQFVMVDRKTLDTIRTEQNFQLSGDVSDQSAVDIGHMLGANFVITGNITGTGNNQRLTIKALEVKTAQIKSMAREAF